MAKKKPTRGRPRIGVNVEVVKGLTLRRDMVSAIMKHARTMKNKSGDPASRNAAIRDLLARGLVAADNEFE